jgi:hypothetical protein
VPTHDIPQAQTAANARETGRHEDKSPHEQEFEAEDGGD